MHILVVRAIPESLDEDRRPDDGRVGLKEEGFMVVIFTVVVCHTVRCLLESNTFQ